MRKVNFNHPLIGFLIGVVCFIAFFYILHGVNRSLIYKELFGREWLGFSNPFVSILAVFVNVIPFLLFSKKGDKEAARGLSILIVLSAVGVALYYFVYLTNGSFLLQ